MPQKTPATGALLHNVPHTPIKKRKFLVLTGLTLFITYAVIDRWGEATTFELIVGQLIVAVLFMRWIQYVLKRRHEPALVIFEKGLWYWLPAGSGTFYAWSDIKDIQLAEVESRGHLHFWLQIEFRNIEKYWERPPLLTRLGIFHERFWSESHLSLLISEHMDIDPDTLQSTAEAALNQHRRSRRRQGRGRAGSVPSLP